MGVDTSHGNENMDYAEHERTYAAFIKLVKYGAAIVAAILILMAYFLL